MRGHMWLWTKWPVCSGPNRQVNADKLREETKISRGRKRDKWKKYELKEENSIPRERVVVAKTTPRKFYITQLMLPFAI